MPLIKINNLHKKFRVHKKEEGFLGSLKALFKRQYIDKEAVVDVSFSVGKGEIIGLLGANGAGKTTLLKMLTGIIHPTKGNVEILGYNPWDRKNEFLKEISLIMGQKAQLWWDLPAADCFLLLKEIYVIPEKQYRETIEELSIKLNVKHLLNIQIRRLSLGERMKMELIASLLHRPKVLFLDEPTIGLDVKSQRVIREFILDYIKKYSPAVILTSHYMDDIQYLCERVLIIRSGKIVYDGLLTDLAQKYSPNKIIKAHFKEKQESLNILLDLQKYGEILHNEKEQIHLMVNRENISNTTNYLLEHYEIIDLSIEEVDISITIESILDNKKLDSINDY